LRCANGPVSLDVLEAEVERWIEAVAAQPGTGGG
jgi:hypothetical protein